MQLAFTEDELVAKDAQLSTSLREAAEINEEYIGELTRTQQQLESEVASLTARLEEASEAAAQRERQDGDMQAAHKRLRGQVWTEDVDDLHACCDVSDVTCVLQLAVECMQWHPVIILSYGTDDMTCIMCYRRFSVSWIP